MDRARAGIGQLRTAMAGLSQAGQKLESVGAGIAGAGARLGAVGATLGAPLALGIREFATYEQSMARVRAITNASTEDFERLGARARQLGIDTAFSADDAAQAMGNLAEAGFNTNEILQASGSVLDLAAVAQMGMADSARIVAGVMRGMNIPVAESGRVVDVLARLSTSGAGNLTQLGDAFMYTGPIARSAGISIDEVAAAMEILGKAGIRGEMAGTTLRGALLSLSAPSVEAAAELDRLGISVIDAQGNWLSLTEVVGQFERAMAGMGNAEQLRVLDEVFGKRGASGFAKIVEAGAREMAAGTQRSIRSTGEAARMAAVQLDTLKGAWELVKSSVSETLIVLGEQLAPTVRTVGAALVQFVNGLSAWIKENGDMILTVGKWAAGLVVAGAALTALGGAIAGAGLVLNGLAATLTAVTAAFSALASVVGFIFSPAGAVVAGVAALAYLWTTTREGQEVLAQFGSAWAGAKDAAVTAWAGIVDAIKGGDLGLAVDVAFAGARLALFRGLRAWERSSETILANMRRDLGQMQHLFSLGTIPLDTGPARRPNLDAQRAAEEALLVNHLELLNQRAREVANTFLAPHPTAEPRLGRMPGMPAFTLPEVKARKYEPPAALERGSAAAFSVINAGRNREDERQERILAAEERGARAMEEVREILRRLPVIGAANF